jgi:hypothetical protein
MAQGGMNGGSFNKNPALDGMVNEARGVSCLDWLARDGHMDKMKRIGGNNYAGPCPKCGGDDRFGVDASQDKWNCRKCGLGGNDAISMVILLYMNLDQGKTYGECFIAACEKITGRSRDQEMTAAEIAEREEAIAAKKRKQEQESARRREQARQDAHKVWQRTVRAGEHVARYFEQRGIATDVGQFSRVIHEIGSLDYWHESRVLHSGPAMVAVIQASDDRFSGVHRTWLDPNGKKGKAVILNADRTETLDSKKVMGTMADGAIRLVTPPGATRMIVGEGIETTLTPFVHAFRPDTAYWCAINLNHMAGRAGKDYATGKRVPDLPDLNDTKCFLVPAWVQDLTLLGDGDSDPEQTRAAMTRAAKRAKARNPAIVVRIAWPRIRGDFNDLVMEQIENDRTDE